MNMNIYEFFLVIIINYRSIIMIGVFHIVPSSKLIHNTTICIVTHYIINKYIYACVYIYYVCIVLLVM